MPRAFYAKAIGRGTKVKSSNLANLTHCKHAAVASPSCWCSMMSPQAILKEATTNWRPMAISATASGAEADGHRPDPMENRLRYGSSKATRPTPIVGSPIISPAVSIGNSPALIHNLSVCSMPIRFTQVSTLADDPEHRLISRMCAACRASPLSRTFRRRCWSSRACSPMRPPALPA